MVGNHSYTKKNRATLIHSGEDFVKTSVKTLAKANEKILFHTYSYTEDDVTAPVIDELIKKAREGVEVFLLLDAFASPEISNSLKNRFSDAGVKWAYFAPLFSKRFEHYGRRLHQKVMVVDNKYAITGGINLAKRFIEPDDDNPWLDYAVLIEGEEVYRLQRKILSLYTKNFPKHQSFLKGSIKKEEFKFEGNLPARTVVNDFMRFKTEIQRSYIRALRGAKKSVKITATYFLPSKRLLKELKKATRRGVEIELIFGERSDHQTERWSSRYLYSWYIKHGIKVYEWCDSILHAKVALIDDSWLSIGSYNHNYVSRYLSLELNIEINDQDFGSKVNTEFNAIKSRSKEISRENWEAAGAWYRRLFYFITYGLSKVVTLISLLFVFRSKEKP